jgi:hypothetical protein
LAAAQLHDGCRLVADSPSSMRYILTLAATPDWLELKSYDKTVATAAGWPH